MKKNTQIVLFCGLCLLSLSILFVSFSQKKATVNSRTEEYAIVDIINNGTNHGDNASVIRITKNKDGKAQSTWEKGGVYDKGNYESVLLVLDSLNNEGFELLTSTMAYETMGGNNRSNFSVPRQSYIMVKKLK